MAKDEIKHGGCAKCGTREVPVLHSVMVRGYTMDFKRGGLVESPGSSTNVALCPKCEAETPHT
jgi:NMD protein affecting ribosome stability and mRNA decay